MRILRQGHLQGLLPVKVDANLFPCLLRIAHQQLRIAINASIGKDDLIICDDVALRPHFQIILPLVLQQISRDWQLFPGRAAISCILRYARDDAKISHRPAFRIIDACLTFIRNGRRIIDQAAFRIRRIRVCCREGRIWR